MALFPQATSDHFLVEAIPHSRLPRLDLGIDWGSPWSEFWTSMRDAFTGPRPDSSEAVSGGADLRVEWVRRYRPGASLVAAALCHVATVWLLILPIWGFLPKAGRPIAALDDVQVQWYVPQDLQSVLLPAHQPKENPATPIAAPKPADRGADAFHPHQTILSRPVRMTHPRQTLIQPGAPADAPKILPQLPNIVEWGATAPKLQVQLAPSAVAPRARRAERRDITAPAVASSEQNPDALHLVPSSEPSALQIPTASASVANARKSVQPEAAAPEIANSASSASLNLAQSPDRALQMPAAPASTAVARNRTRQDAAAPQIGSPSDGNATDLHKLVAISAAPAPPAPEVRVPKGNLAANVSISPDGTHHGSPAGSGKPGVTASDSSSLPAAVSVSRTAAPAPAVTLNLKPMIPANTAPAPRSGPVNVAALAPGAPPEKLLTGRVYTLHVSTPNMVSSRGSWILNFAQLGEDPLPMNREQGELAGPSPTHIVDPEYPPEAVEQHIDGEVILYAIIRKDGSVDSIQVVQSLDPRLDRCAIDALAQWRFHPGARAGAPVDLEAVVHVPFQYKKPF